MHPIADLPINDVTGRLLGELEPLDRFEIEQTNEPLVEADGIWTAGIPYRISERTREEESIMPDM